MNGDYSTGGDGGGPVGGNGRQPSGEFGLAGEGASQSGGGNWGRTSGGLLGQGGNAHLGTYNAGASYLMGGGGGGGYYGGGGGNIIPLINPPSGGGGGSGYGPEETIFETGVRSGDGVATLSFSGITIDSDTGHRNVTETTAELSAVINPHGRSNLPVRFVWGTDSAILGESFDAPPISGDLPQLVRATITGLTPGTKYWYRAFVPGALIETSTDIGSFTTLVVTAGEPGDGDDSGDGSGGEPGDGRDGGPGGGDGSGGGGSGSGNGSGAGESTGGSGQTGGSNGGNVTEPGSSAESGEVARLPYTGSNESTFVTGLSFGVLLVGLIMFSLRRSYRAK